MNRRKFVIAAFAIGMIASVGSTANAGPPTSIECTSITGGSFQGKLQDLCDATKATWFKNDQDKDGLVSKIYGAGIKLDSNKMEDAEKKLTEFDVKLMYLMSPCNKKIDCQAARNIQDALTAVFNAFYGL